MTKILIAYDGSEGAQKALDLAIDLAKRFRAKLHMIMVKELRFATMLDDVANAEEEASQRFEQVIADAVALATKRRIVIEPHVVAGHPVPTIVEFKSATGSIFW
jgi:nucleotide-binding universal stress UspA family protein